MKSSYLMILLFFVSFNFQLTAQDMDNQKLNGIIYTLSDELEGENGNWRFAIDSTIFICLTDELHNRMRIISPISEIQYVSDQELRKCMEANFHTALDVKYAVSEDILWSVFIHPLRELTKEQVISGISQVYSCVKTYGTEYSGGFLNFPSKEDRKTKDN